MSENHLTRREDLTGLAGLPFLAGALDAQAAASSVCFMSTVEMARLIRTKKLSAREALAAHLMQIERINPKVNAIVTLVPEMAAAAAAKADEMQARGGRRSTRCISSKRRSMSSGDSFGTPTVIKRSVSPTRCLRRSTSSRTTLPRADRHRAAPNRDAPHFRTTPHPSRTAPPSGPP